MKIRISKDDVKGLEPLPQDTYDFVVATVEHKVKAGADKDDPGYFNLQLDIENPEDGRHVPVFDVLSLKDNARWKLGEFCKAVGLIEDADDIDDDGLEIDSDEFQGLEGRVSIKQETYEGRVRNKVDKYLAS